MLFPSAVVGVYPNCVTIPTPIDDLRVFGSKPLEYGYSRVDPVAYYAKRLGYPRH